MATGGSAGVSDFLSSPAGQATTQTFVNYVGSLLGRYATGTVGTGKMAARGQAAFAAKVQRAQFAQLAAQRNLDLAYGEFERTNPFEAGFVVETPGGLGTLPPKVVKLLGKNVEKLSQLRAKAQTKKVIAKEKKISEQITARQAKLAPYTEVRVSELRGPNAGFWRERGAPPPLWLTQRRDL